MWYNQIKTVVLLSALSGIFLLLGGYIGGREGLTFAFIIALVMNFIAYFFSEKIVLSMYRAQKLDEHKYAWIYAEVRQLASALNIPMPKLWLINTSIANAFATGRNPTHASVAVTTGILEILDEHELRGVLAHELSHIKNRDILVSTIAATLATAIGYVANMLQQIAFWGSMNQENNQRRGNPLIMLLIAIIMPIAATLIQLAVSRSREYLADESGAHCSKDPLALASALEKLESHTKMFHFGAKNVEYASTAHLFIVNPFLGDFWVTLFSTHPPMAKRIELLRKMIR